MKSLHVVLAAPRGPDVVPGGAEVPVWDPGLEAIRAHFEPAGAPPVPIGSGAVAVVIDVLRATTSLTVARAHGAARVIAAETVEEARALARERPGALLCGERGGELLPGFDLGNSPFEYTRARVAGKTLVFASTNGSQAMRLAAGAHRLWVGAFVNASAVVERVAGATEVHLVASGKLGQPAIEDVACAGWIARALEARGFAPRGVEVALARDVAPIDAGGVRDCVEHSAHAAMLEALGPPFVRDVEFCATLDAIDGAWEL